MSLRISRVVERCPATRLGDRARFAYDNRWLTPEAIVLRRWRDRSTAGTRFDGCRLPPGTWRVVQACLDRGLTPPDASDPAKLSEYVAAVRCRHKTWRAPQVEKLAALIDYLHRNKHLSDVLSIERKESSPGIPDLFLYRTGPRGVHGGVFVEVKRKNRQTGYKERLLPSQREEHEALSGLGLKVEVVYLVES